MSFHARFIILALPVVAWAFAASDPEPRYDTATVVDLRVVAVEMRETPDGKALAGLHLMARLESAKSDSDLIDIYLGPVAFIKDFNFPFGPRERLEVVGSKVRVAGGSVILARELRHGTDTLYIRDKAGEPFWKTSNGA